MLTRNCFVLILCLTVSVFLLWIGEFLHHLFIDDEEVQASKNTLTRTGKITNVEFPIRLRLLQVRLSIIFEKMFEHFD